MLHAQQEAQYKLMHAKGVVASLQECKSTGGSW